MRLCRQRAAAVRRRRSAGMAADLFQPLLRPAGRQAPARSPRCSSPSADRAWSSAGWSATACSTGRNSGSGWRSATAWPAPCFLSAALALPPGPRSWSLLGLRHVPCRRRRTGPAGAMVAGLTPAAIHGTAFATLTLANNFLGLAPGPIVTGWLADQYRPARGLAVAAAGQHSGGTGVPVCPPVLAGESRFRGVRNDIGFVRCGSRPWPGSGRDCWHRWSIAAAAAFLADHYAGPVMLFALLLGMAMNFLSEVDRCKRRYRLRLANRASPRRRAARLPHHAVAKLPPRLAAGGAGHRGRHAHHPRFDLGWPGEWASSPNSACCPAARPRSAAPRRPWRFRPRSRPMR